ncbi:MAG: 1-acyl-sn-glycerol-3-phosphate acyltransferase [Gammaproteobacteria bacterium]|nr:1-acyl-sn-glycerol-3-phosphate acyltransferase [Gammaproteobacteria bacterium]
MHRLILAARVANRIDWGRGWMNFIDGLNRLFCYRYHRLNVSGLRLPKRGPAIVVSNHLSGLDPLLLIATSRRPLRFLIATEQYHRFGLNWLFRALGCIPVDRSGRPERALRVALRALQSGEVVALFPQGAIHLDSDTPRRLKPGAARLSQLTGAPLYPQRLSGIAGAGHVLMALVFRSRARLDRFPPIYAGTKELATIQAELSSLLDANLGDTRLRGGEPDHGTGNRYLGCNQRRS